MGVSFKCIFSILVLLGTQFWGVASADNRCVELISQIISESDNPTISISKKNEGFGVTGSEHPVSSKAILHESILEAYSRNLNKREIRFHLDGFSKSEARELAGEIEILLRSRHPNLYQSNDTPTTVVFAVQEGRSLQTLARSLNKPGYWNRSTVEVLDPTGAVVSGSNSTAGIGATVRVSVKSPGKPNTNILISGNARSLSQTLIEKIVSVVRRLLGRAEAEAWNIDKTLVELKRELKKADVDLESIEVILREEAGDTMIVEEGSSLFKLAQHRRG